MEIGDHGQQLALVRLGKRYKNGRVHITERLVVNSRETRCAYLAVHETCDAGPPGFIITHMPTGYYIMRGLPDERTAQYCAGALTEIFDWGRSVEGRPNETLWVDLSKLPPRLRAWIKLWQ